jgi:DNA-binding PadR family transcriptional regulator
MFLSILSQYQPYTPVELKAEFEYVADVEVARGSLYPTIYKLERQGFVKRLANGRYKITATGEKNLIRYREFTKKV